MKLLLAGAAILLIFAAMPAYAQNSSSDSLHAYAVYVDGKSYIITYNITGGSVKFIEAQNKGIITATIQADSDGKLLINMPASLLSSISFDTKTDPIVFLDGIEVFGNMTHTSCGIGLEIPFQKGGKKIEMTGSFILIGGTMSAKDDFFQIAQNEDKGFELGTIANAGTCNISFDQGAKRLHVQTNGEASEEGFFQISLPHEFLGGPYTVLVEGRPIEFKSAFSNATGRDATTVSFQYDGDKVHNIDIIGTTAIPEFGPVAVVAVAIPMAMLMIVRFKSQ